MAGGREEGEKERKREFQISLSDRGTRNLEKLGSKFSNFVLFNLYCMYMYSYNIYVYMRPRHIHVYVI